MPNDFTYEGVDLHQVKAALEWANERLSCGACMAKLSENYVHSPVCLALHHMALCSRPLKGGPIRSEEVNPY